jgi:ketosteroid isomerase-like protein
MQKFFALAGLTIAIAAPASADDRALITHQRQEMSDALTGGDAAVWDKYVDPGFIFAEEDDSYKGKAEALKEIRPLPKGLGGNIHVELLSYHEDGDVAVALFRQVETENYYAQTIHANYLTMTTWRKRADGWKEIAEQALAEKTDPPAIALPAAQLAQYAGTYKLKGSEATYTVTIADGKLTATRNGRKAVTWNAEASDVFFANGDPRIRDIFQRDVQGHVTGFVERRESWDIVWEKIG